MKRQREKAEESQPTTAEAARVPLGLEEQRGKAALLKLRGWEAGCGTETQTLGKGVPAAGAGVPGGP